MIYSSNPINKSILIFEYIHDLNSKFSVIIDNASFLIYFILCLLLILFLNIVFSLFLNRLFNYGFYINDFLNILQIVYDNNLHLVIVIDFIMCFHLYSKYFFNILDCFLNYKESTLIEFTFLANLKLIILASFIFGPFNYLANNN